MKEMLNHLCEVDRSASEWSNFEYKGTLIKYAHKTADDLDYKLKVAEYLHVLRACEQIN